MPKLLVKISPAALSRPGGEEFVPPLGRGRRGGFTLVEVMVALCIFAIAFTGMLMLSGVQIMENVETESEIRVAARASEVKEEIYSLAHNQIEQPGASILPGIQAVIRDYEDNDRNRQAKRSRFSLRLPALEDEAQFIVALYTDERRVPRYMTRLGDYDTITDSSMSDMDREEAQMDLNGNGIIEDDIDLSRLKVLPVEVGATWKSRNGNERFLRTFILVTR